LRFRDICPGGDRGCIQTEQDKIKAFTDVAQAAIRQGREEVSRLSNGFQMGIGEFQDAIASADQIREDIARENNGHHVDVAKQLVRDQKEELKRLEDILKQLKDEIEVLQDDIRQLTEDIAESKEELKKRNEKIEKLQKDVKELEDAIDKLEKKIEELKELLKKCQTIDRVRQELEKLEEDKAKIVAETEVINDKIDNSNHEIGKVDKKISELEVGEIKKLNEQIGSLKKDIEDADNERAKRHEAHAQTAAQILNGSSLAAVHGKARKSLAQWRPEPQLPAAPYDGTGAQAVENRQKWYNIFRCGKPSCGGETSEAEGDETLQNSLMNPSEGSAFTRLITTCGSTRPEQCAEIDAAAYPVIFNAFSFTSDCVAGINNDAQEEAIANQLLQEELKRLHDIIEENEQQISSMNDKIKDAQKLKEELEQELEDLMEEMDTISEQLEQAGATINGLEKNIQNLADEKERLETDREELEEKIETLNEINDEACDEDMVDDCLEMAQEDLASAQEDIQNSKAAHKEAVDEEKKLKDSMEVKLKKIRELESGLEFTDLTEARKELSKQMMKLQKLKSISEALGGASNVHRS